jgi:hypothetical protein
MYQKIRLLSMSLAISGSASFGEGVARAFLKKQQSQDLRKCKISGKSFSGTQSSLEQAGDTAKLLMVDGVGTNASQLSASD